MKVWHWIQYAFALSEVISVMAAAPVSLISAWILWTRNDRLSRRDGWRQAMLFAGMLILSLAAAVIALTFGGEWWARDSRSPLQELVLNDLSVTGAMCCMFAVLASALGKGRARLSLAAGGLFGLFLYGIVTPFGIVP